MKVALKYGIAVTIVIVAWVALKRLVLHIEAPMLDLIIFNVTAIVGLFLAIRARRRAGHLTFKDGLKTGLLTVMVYAVLISLYFAVLLVALGPAEMMQGHVGANNLPMSTMIIGAFAGLLVGFLAGGVIYATIISVILRSKSPVH